MESELVNKFSQELHESGSVTFDFNNEMFCIYESSQEDGFMIDVFELGADIDVDEPFDGGLCTGSARDAVEFMLSCNN